MSGFETLEVDNILRAIKTWAESQSKIDAFALVGSWARKEATKNSDIDLMILTANPDLFFRDKDWFNRISWHDLNLKVVSYDDRIYGVVKSRHLFFERGQRIEFSFGYPSWANTNPIDPGTLIVVTSGIEIICDRYESLKSLILAI
ncbi:MAG: hypothetical protein RLZZ574_955 [Cyanobacteriota bacterium]|jgi:hypothetical protein